MPPHVVSSPLPDGDSAQVGFWGRLWLPNRKAIKATSKSQTTQPPQSSALTGITEDEAIGALQSLRHRLRVWSLLGAVPTSTSLFIFLAEANNSYYGHPEAVVPWLVGASFVSYFCAVSRPRTLVAARLRQMREKPLSAAEIASLLPLSGDELERSYLTLVMDVSRQEVASQAAAGIDAGPRADLREALQALGDAIDRLPTGRVVGNGSGNERSDIMTEVLRRTAEETLRQAQAEPDRVVAASLVRQVEALHRRADATARANTLVRRLSALRQEMAAETEALRAGLAAYYTGAGDVADLTRLVQSVREVAREAASVTSAVEEVDGLTDGSFSADSRSATAPAWTSGSTTGLKTGLQAGEAVSEQVHLRRGQG
ncbi:MAG: hypothetical protein V4671_18420 [Armatimonadota bacterium]